MPNDWAIICSLPLGNVTDICHKAHVPHKRVSKEVGARIKSPKIHQVAQCKNRVLRQMYDTLK